MKSPFLVPLRLSSFLLPTFLVSFFITSSFSASAQSTPAAGESTTETASEISVEELILRAQQNNPQTQIALANLEAARLRAGALKSLPNPVLQIVPGFSGSEEARDEEIILSQPLDLFGQRKARGRVLSAQIRSMEAQSTLVARALVIEVKNAATNLFAAQEAESLGISQVEVAQQFRAAAARRAELGDVPPVQAQRAELELLRVQNELLSARAERLIRLAILNQLIGQTPETPLHVGIGNWETVANAPSTPAAPSGIPTSQSSLPTSIFSQRGSLLSGLISRPDILGAEATLEARRAEVDAIGKQRLPQVELQLRRDAVFGGGDVAVRAVISAPLFDFGAIKNEKRAAQAEVQAQESQIFLLKSQAALQVEQALIRFEQQRAIVENFRNGIVPQTLDLLRKTQIGFDAGASTYLEVLEAQRTLRVVQAEYLQALVGARTSESQLESALGASLPESLTSEIRNPRGPSTPPGVTAPGTIAETVFVPNTITPQVDEQVNENAGGAN